MFFKPNFCCGCGEKIQRAEWGILTSRRFCDVCAVENQGHELIPRVTVIAAVLIGLFGFGSYLRSGESAHPVMLKRTEQGNAAPASGAALKPPRDPQTADLNGAGSVEIPAEAQLNTLDRDTAPPSRVQPQVSGVASDEAVHFCGAMTKKGKPCSRRVKTKGRCWQHVGQPSALASRAAPDVY